MANRRRRSFHLSQLAVGSVSVRSCLGEAGCTPSAYRAAAGTCQPPCTCLRPDCPPAAGALRKGSLSA